MEAFVVPADLKLADLTPVSRGDEGASPVSIQKPEAEQKMISQWQWALALSQTRARSRANPSQRVTFLEEVQWAMFRSGPSQSARSHLAVAIAHPYACDIDLECSVLYYWQYASLSFCVCRFHTERIMEMIDTCCDELLTRLGGSCLCC